MAVTSRDLQHTGALRRQSLRPVPMVATYQRVSRLPYVLTLLLCLGAIGLVANNVLTWAQIKLDDLRYGRPRTMQLAGFVGHNEAAGVPTQFVAMNLNRRVVVFEIPGGDPSQTRTLSGPYLFGANEHLTPVRLALADVNADQQPDLIVTVKNEQIIYINENGAFRLITPAERAAYEQRR
ncbi:hypothetical protein [Kallotenue papyrolyticum]|uniref:hypothetical protein n=1 Tax=Kallotenue papyrolyticum TaxID=1325125 RepID=UPI0004785A1C|nr:hypothetical protein [Kallotenue papyrolyticum]